MNFFQFKTRKSTRSPSQTVSFLKTPVCFGHKYSQFSPTRKRLNRNSSKKGQRFPQYPYSQQQYTGQERLLTIEDGARESGTLDQAPAVPSRCEDGGPPSPVSKLRDQKEPCFSQLWSSRLPKGEAWLMTTTTAIPDGNTSQCPSIPHLYPRLTKKHTFLLAFPKS